MSQANGTDPRIQRTRASLQEALLTLCKQRDLDEVSVSEVAEAAGVNRTTFYQHYADLNTLLADALDAIATASHAQLEVQMADLGEMDYADIISKYLQHVHDNASLYRRVLGSTGSPVIVARLTERVSIISESGMRASGFSESALPIPIAAASVAGSFVGILRAWLQMRPMPSADVATEWALATLAPMAAVVNQTDG